MGCVYKVENLENGMIYIGKTIGTLSSRKSSHIWDSNNGSTLYFHNALKKYGSNNFSWIEIYSSEDNEKLIEKEMEYISIFKKNKKLYNLTEGGDGTTGLKRTPEHTAKLLEAARIGSKQKFVRKVGAQNISNIISLYKTKEYTISKLAQIYKVSSSAMRNFLRNENGLPLMQERYSHLKKPRVVTNSIKLALYTLYDRKDKENLSFKEIAIKCGVSKRTAVRIYHENYIKEKHYGN